MKLDGIQFFKKIPARESLVLLGETNFWLVATVFFSISQRLLAVSFFSSLVEKYFFKQSPSFQLMEADFLPRRNRFLLFRVLPRK